MAGPAEWSLDDLRVHLQAAVELELMLIPPYLCAMCSIHPGTNSEAELIIRSVVVEEMLHMTLAANLLNAVGGTPCTTDRRWIGNYPAKLPYHDRHFAVDLRPLDDTALTTFLAVEQPTYPITEPPLAAGEAAEPRLLALGDDGEEYATIGAFYDAIEEGLEQLVRRLGPDQVFMGDPGRQVGPGHYYASGGEAIVIDGIDAAKRAITEIVEQGEGERTAQPPDEKFDGERDLAHFYRFNELRQGQRYKVGDYPKTPTGERIAIDWDAIYPMAPNPKVDDLPPGELRDATESCNALWYGLLQELEVGLTGRPDRLRLAVGQMFSLKYAMTDLMRIRRPDGLHAGPTFELPPV